MLRHLESNVLVAVISHVNPERVLLLVRKEELFVCGVSVSPSSRGRASGQRKVSGRDESAPFLSYVGGDLLRSPVPLAVLRWRRRHVCPLLSSRVLVGPLLSWTKGCVFLSRDASQKSKPALSYRSQTVRGPLDRTVDSVLRIPVLIRVAGESPE